MVERDGFRTVRLPAELVDRVEAAVKRHKGAGYKSLADFFADAARHLLADLARREGFPEAPPGSGAKSVLDDPTSPRRRRG